MSSIIIFLLTVALLICTALIFFVAGATLGSKAVLDKLKDDGWTISDSNGKEWKHD